MFVIDRDAVICDLAETYHIFNYKELPCRAVALFACGLREDSRIKMILGNAKISNTDALLAGIADRLSTLIWFQTKDGQKGINRPKAILDALLGENQKDELASFDDGETFEKNWKNIVGREGE